MRGPHRALVALVLVVPLLAGACTDDGDSDAFCDRVGEVVLPAEVLAQLDPADPAGSRRQLEAVVEEFRALEADAPGAIRADVARLREGVELVVAAVKENPDDLAAARAAITERTDELAGLAQAGQAVVSYADEECGITLDDLGGGGRLPATTGDPDGTGSTTSTPASSPPGPGG